MISFSTFAAWFAAATISLTAPSSLRSQELPGRLTAMDEFPAADRH
ncbi:MAG TPA: hypothetical protein VOA78_01845 [Candidatus Dormibacteraeota bacterium]|nr:hypothetical protein [Candidatus Dormibacteraeota bacterium]